jgi:hypothetical protein
VISYLAKLAIISQSDKTLLRNIATPKVTVYDRHTHSTSNPTERPPRFGRYGRTVGFRIGTAYGRPLSVWTAKSTAEQ